jgi:hypothetical protein
MEKTDSVYTSKRFDGSGDPTVNSERSKNHAFQRSARRDRRNPLVVGMFAVNPPAPKPPLEIAGKNGKSRGAKGRTIQLGAFSPPGLEREREPRRVCPVGFFSSERMTLDGGGRHAVGLEVEATAWRESRDRSDDGSRGCGGRGCVRGSARSDSARAVAAHERPGVWRRAASRARSRLGVEARASRCIAKDARLRRARQTPAWCIKGLGRECRCCVMSGGAIRAARASAR